MVVQYTHLSVLVPSPAEDFSIILKNKSKSRTDEKLLIIDIQISMCFYFPMLCDQNRTICITSPAITYD